MPESPRTLQGFFVALLIVLLVENSWGVSDAMRKPCADCHTMHDSSGGQGVALGPLGGADLVGPQEALVNFTCSGCHVGSNTGAATDTPFVAHMTVAPSYGSTGTSGDTLAGGNFYWVVNNDGGPKGHDVVGLGISQTTRVPPGEPNGDLVFSVASPLRCAGTNGCHGDTAVASQTMAIWGAHHGNTLGQAVATPGSLLTATSYRFLNGIVGYEDSDWEFQPTKDLHNQYKGVVRLTDGAADVSTISSACTSRCHGDFHNGAGTDYGVDASAGSFASPWIRHPIDIDMGGLNGEYLGYGNPVLGDQNYNVNTPLASTDVTGVLNSVAALSSASGKAIITCLSCHRAHGSPFDYSMRWDYKNWPGAGYNGCGDCHTYKN